MHGMRSTFREEFKCAVDAMHNRLATMATGYAPFVRPVQGPPPPAVKSSSHRPRPPVAQRPGFGKPPPRAPPFYIMPHNMPSMPAMSYGGYYMPYVE